MNQKNEILNNSDNPNQNIPAEYKKRLVSRGLELANTLEKRIITHFLNEYKRYYKMAVEHCRARKYDEAIPCFTKCLKIRDYIIKDNAIYKEDNVDLSEQRVMRILIGRGLCYCSIGKYLAGAGDFAYVVCLNRQHDKAYKYLEKTIEYLPEDIKYLIKLGEEKGCLTYHDVNENLPSYIITSDDIDNIILMFGAKNIVIIDDEKIENIVLANLRKKL